MKLALLPSALLVLLASCGPNKHLNAWDRQSSALDPVGITSKKMAAKNKADQAFYKPGESVTFKKEKMMVFEQNPENNFSTSGTVRGGVKTGKVLVCGDLSRMDTSLVPVPDSASPSPSGAAPQEAPPASAPLPESSVKQ